MGRHEWARDERSRYGVYLGDPKTKVPLTTSLDGIGITLRTMKEDGDLTEHTMVCVLDGFTGEWLVSPFPRDGRRRGGW